MRKTFKKLAALISLSFADNSDAVVHSMEIPDSFLKPDKLNLADLNVNVSPLLAGHRSHSSHRSHGSHRSSSGGGYRSPPVKNYSPPPLEVPKIPPKKADPPKQQLKETTQPQKKADPLGQQARPKSSYPSSQGKNNSQKLKNDEKIKNIIMRIQLTLQFEEYYNGPIDGIMNSKTRESIIKFKKAKGISSKKLLDAATLNALGIKGF